MARFPEVARRSIWMALGSAMILVALAGVAETQPHWSRTLLVSPRVPPGPDHPIDAFIEASLESRDLSPSPRADRRTLIRRVHHDLTGLPPTPGEVRDFVTSTDPEAYTGLINRLLASPRYGERWARHWLDTIHYADSTGGEHDIKRDHAWRFRDYVIASFNRDTAWPRFIREQLAADVFYPGETDLVPALGFLGAGVFELSTFSTAPVTFAYLDRDDLVTQTMAAFTSTTANCARCHDHKFDPISQEDYYALQAVFAGVLKGDVAYDNDPDAGRQRARWTSLKAAAQSRDAAILLQADHQRRVTQWLASRNNQATTWTQLNPKTFLSGEGATLTRLADNVLLAGGKNPETDTYTVTANPGVKRVTAIRLELFPHASLPERGPGRAPNGNLHLTELVLHAFEPGATESKPLKFARAVADFDQGGWGIANTLDGDRKTAWGIYPEVAKSHQGVFVVAEPANLVEGATLAVTLNQFHGGSHLIGSFRLSVTGDDPSTVEPLPAAVAEALALEATSRTQEHQVTIAAHVLQRAAEEALAALPQQAMVYAAGKSVMITQDGNTRAAHTIDKPKTVHVLNRGAIDQPGAIATPGALSMLTHQAARFPLDDNESARRAALADWVAHPDNRLTWRSIVNRVWHYHFGRGICDTPNDFGKMGGTPSHPELLDWLAVWFRDEAKGSLKQLHHLILTSETYRQSSQYRADAARVDAENRLLWRQNRQRLDADTVRDHVLALAGTLDLTMGGPGIEHFSKKKGPQNTPELNYETYDWSGPGAGRRSIYRVVWRGIPDPFMEALDFPDMGLLAPTRPFSASALQSLALFNNRFMLHHAKAMAARVTQHCATTEMQVTEAVERAWLRQPTREEQGEFESFVAAHGLPAFCRLLLNSNEFLFVD